MELDALTLHDVEEARRWRNKMLYSLRTPYRLTQQMQQKYYEEHVCNRDSRERFMAVREKSILVAMVGFVKIEWENHLAELSNICNPAYNHRRMETIDLLLQEGFLNMGFSNLYFECYHCDPGINFWQEVVNRYHADTATLKSRKFWGGCYWNSLYLNIHKSHFPATDGRGKGVFSHVE